MTEPGLLPHNRAIELLPWLVNGTLTGAEREAVEQHARACIACRHELKQQQWLHAAVRSRRTLDVSAEAGFDRLDAELDGEAPGPRRRHHLYAALKPFAVAAAAGLAVLAILVWFTPLPDLGPGDYSTLATPRASDAAVLDIVFTDETTAAEMQQLLDDIGGEIVAGPSSVGRYSVRIAPEQETATTDLAALLEALSSDPRVRFAGRASTDVAP